MTKSYENQAIQRLTETVNGAWREGVATNASVQEGNLFVSFMVGLLTRYRTDFKAFSLERIEQWHFQKKEISFAKRGCELRVAHSGWTVPELHRSSLFHMTLETNKDMSP